MYQDFGEIDRKQEKQRDKAQQINVVLKCQHEKVINTAS